MTLPNEILVNATLGIIGFVLTILIAMTAYFLMRLISQLDKTTITVQDLSVSFQKIAQSIKTFENDTHKNTLMIIDLKSDIKLLKSKLRMKV